MQQFNARRKASMRAALSQSDNVRSTLVSFNASKTSGQVALTEQLLRSKSAASAAAAKAKLNKTA